MSTHNLCFEVVLMSIHNLCFQAEIRKNNIYPDKPQFYYLKVGFKGTISLKNRHFIVQERFNKLIHGINTIIKCGT